MTANRKRAGICAALDSAARRTAFWIQKPSLPARVLLALKCSGRKRGMKGL